MAKEKVAHTGVSKEKGYLYYLGKDGNVWRSGMSRGGKGGGVTIKNILEKTKKPVLPKEIKIGNNFFLIV